MRITIAICTLLVGFAAVNDGFPMTLPFACVWMLYWLVSFRALYRFTRRDSTGPDSTPLVICVWTLLLVYLLPLDKLSRFIEFKRNEAEFAQIIERIHAGTLAPEPVVPNAYQRRRDYRTGNKKIAVTEHNRKEVVFFYEFRSSDGPEGYVYDPSGAGSKLQRQRINENWYYGRP